MVKMKFLLLLSLLLLAISCCDAFVSFYGGDDETKQVDAVIPNPYGQCHKDDAPPSLVEGDDENDNNSVCPVVLDRTMFEPYYLITTPLQTQMDTFQNLEYAKIMDVLVPVYSMKQPERLNPAQLQFQLVLVRELKGNGAAMSIQTIPADPVSAKDSWFPGYEWSPLIMPCGGNGSGTGNQQQHVGWKFTASTITPNSNKIPHFYALMVQVSNRNSNKIFESVRLLDGIRAPTAWMNMITK